MHCGCHPCFPNPKPFGSEKKVSLPRLCASPQPRLANNSEDAVWTIKKSLCRLPSWPAKGVGGLPMLAWAAHLHLPPLLQPQPCQRAAFQPSCDGLPARAPPHAVPGSSWKCIAWRITPEDYRPLNIHTEPNQRAAFQPHMRWDACQSSP